MSQPQNSAPDAKANASFNPRTIAIVIAMSVMSFGGLLTLLAWGPELQSKDRAGAHAYSSSALGYAGLVKLLEFQGRTVNISRTPRMLNERGGLKILAPGVTASKLEDQLPLSGPMLVILPKWHGQRDRLKPEWQSDLFLSGVNKADRILSYFDETAEVKHLDPPNAMTVRSKTFSTVFEEKIQLIKSKELEIIIGAPGGALLARDIDSDIYFLSDPDLANNFGLASSENARLMLTILKTIDTDPTAPIVFDATLNGFERSTNLLRIMLDIPFLGATLTFLAGILLLGWAACIRFGAPEREEPAFALGKQALADNTAGLFTMTHREARMAPGYLTLSRKAVAKALGAPASLSEAELSALLDRLGPDKDSGQSWSQMADGLRAPSKTRDDLLNKAQRLYRWRKEKTHGHK